MIVRFSKEFSKSAEKLSGKLKESVRKVINEVIDVNCIEEISNVRKLRLLIMFTEYALEVKELSLSYTSKSKGML